MISRREFHTALSLAVATASLPSEAETPLDGAAPKPGLDCVCIDFWPGDSLRIVGTNGRRMVVIHLTVAGLPNTGKFLMPLDAAANALWTFAPISETDDRRVNMAFFGPEQMIFTSGDDAQMVESVKTLYPEYHIMLEDKSVPPMGATYDLGTLTWVLNQCALVTEQTGQRAVAAHIRTFGATTIRPRLRAGFQAIRSVTFAIKPLGVSG